MNMSNLALMSTELLMKLEEAVKVILTSRLDVTPRIGRLATFKDREGIERTIVIERISGKSVSGQETGLSIKPGGKWRIGKSNLRVVPEIRKVALPIPSPTTPHKPQTAHSDSW